MTSQPIILIVEDEVHISNLLETNLQLDGYEVLVTDNGKEALQIVASRRLDIILLDVMLPDCNGVDLCRRIKQKRSDIPILMLSALGQSKDRIAGLKSGADDYLPKPFDLEELTLRINNLIKRSPGVRQIDTEVEIGLSKVNFEQLTLVSKGENHTLSVKESLLLKYMYENRGQILSRQNILDKVWGYEHYPHTRTIDNFIASLRRYIEEDPNKPEFITTVRGLGYILN